MEAKDNKGDSGEVTHKSHTPAKTRKVADGRINSAHKGTGATADLRGQVEGLQQCWEVMEDSRDPSSTALGPRALDLPSTHGQLQRCPQRGRQGTPGAQCFLPEDCLCMATSAGQGLLGSGRITGSFVL